MLGTLLFDLPEKNSEPTKARFWLKIALLLSIGYLIFAYVLVGLPQVSKGGIAFVMISALWLIVGLVSRQAKFPPILLLPSLFYTFILVSGFALDPYPVDYIGQMTTLWIGAIVLATFVSNGISINVVIGGFVVVFVANLVAINMGIDTAQMAEGGHDLNSLQYTEIKRYSGLAGHINRLVGLLFTLPFLLFLAPRKYNIIVYILLLAAAAFVIVISGSRSTLVFAALFAVSGALWLMPKGHARNFCLFAGVVGSIVLAIFFSNENALRIIEDSPLGEETIVKRTLQMIDGDDGSSETREALATGFWPQFNEKPFIGHGPNMFAEVSGTGLYAHNNFAEIAINWGLVGLLAYYSMYALALAGILASPHKIPMMAVLLYLALADIGFVTFTNRGMVLILCLMLISVYSSHGSGRKRRKKKKRRKVSRGVEF